MEICFSLIQSEVTQDTWNLHCRIIILFAIAIFSFHSERLNTGEYCFAKNEFYFLFLFPFFYLCRMLHFPKMWAGHTNTDMFACWNVIASNLRQSHTTNKRSFMYAVTMPSLCARYYVAVQSRWPNDERGGVNPWSQGHEFCDTGGQMDCWDFYINKNDVKCALLVNVGLHRDTSHFDQF